MLAKPVAARTLCRFCSACIPMFVLLDFRKAVQRGADEFQLFRCPDLARHHGLDLAAAHHQHPAPAQKLLADLAHGPLFFGHVRAQILRQTQFWADGHISQLVYLVSISAQKARCGLLCRTDVCKCFFHFRFRSSHTFNRKAGIQCGCLPSACSSLLGIQLDAQKR